MSQLRWDIQFLRIEFHYGGKSGTNGLSIALQTFFLMKGCILTKALSSPHQETAVSSCLLYYFFIQFHFYTRLEFTYSLFWDFTSQNGSFKQSFNQELFYSESHIFENWLLDYKMLVCQLPSYPNNVLLLLQMMFIESLQLTAAPKSFHISYVATSGWFDAFWGIKIAGASERHVFSLWDWS